MSQPNFEFSPPTSTQLKIREDPQNHRLTYQPLNETTTKQTRIEKNLQTKFAWLCKWAPEKLFNLKNILIEPKKAKIIPNLKRHQRNRKL